MFSLTSGPHGAEEEREDFWQDIPEGQDMLPGLLQTDSAADFEAVSGLLVQEPYSPALAHNQAQAEITPEENGEPATNDTDAMDGTGDVDGADDQDTDEDTDGADDADDEDTDDTQVRPRPYVSGTDPLGSWTGTPTGPEGADEQETPTQDQDDL